MSKPSKVLIKCPNCAGKGQVELFPALEETLKVIPRTAPISTADIALVMKSSMGSIFNRLARLQKLGLVANKKVGRERIWTRA